MRTGIYLALLIFAPSASYGQLQGIDVSRWQFNINWTSVKNAGIDFAFIKATEGVDSIDPYFTQNFTNARAAGVPAGPYHYARPDSFNTNPLDASNEANDFVDAIQPYYEQYPGEYLRPVIDVEELPGVSNNKAFLKDWLHDFIDVVETRLGVSPIIYCNSNYAINYIDSSLAQYDLWLANWTHDPNDPPSSFWNGVWDEWRFWQWTNQWSVPGIGGDVDGDVFDGTMADLAEFRVGGLQGDYNGDSRVDAIDYSVWRSMLGTTGDSLAADGDHDGDVDALDYQIWRSHYGDSIARIRPPSAHPAPEPHAAGLLILLVTVCLAARRQITSRSC